MRVITVICDHCGADLSDAGPMPSYRIALASEAIPNSGPAMFDVAVGPQIPEPMHFCKMACLTGWITAGANVPKRRLDHW